MLYLPKCCCWEKTARLEQSFFLSLAKQPCEKTVENKQAALPELAEREAEKQGLDTAKARDLLLAHPAMIKRPLLDQDGTLTLGFKADLYQSLFSR